MNISLTRSALYVPGDHNRAMAKATNLPADMLIFDLEDGVAPERKAIARDAIVQSLNESEHTAHTLIRANHLSTSYYTHDIAAIAESGTDGIMLSKVSGTKDIDQAVSDLAKHDRADMPIWCNVETPLGVTNINSIAAHPNVAGIVVGTNDLANDLRIIRTSDRAGLMHSLQAIQLAARAYDKIVLDGTFVDLEDMDGLRTEAKQGRILGFDGKTLIHPKQIEIANEIFSPSEEDVAQAKAIIETYEQAMKDHKAVALLDGKMIEKLHYDRAKEICSLGI